MLDIALLLLFYGFSPVSSHGLGDDYIYYFDAVMPAGTVKCGPQTLTGWTVNIDRFRKPTGPREDFTYFSSSTGVFSAPDVLNARSRSTNGIYHCCASARCRKGGVCDFSIVDGTGSVRASFGTRLATSDWSSHMACTLEKLKTGETLKVVLQSGGGNDCLEETGWNYARFSCHLATMA